MTNFNYILSLNRGVTKYGKAPHKPILLLAVVDGFEKGYLKGREVPISEELLTSFHDYWKLLVNTQNEAHFYLPFYHLGSEKSGFWQLKLYAGKEIPVTKSNSIKSYKALYHTVEYALLSEDLALALQNPVQRNEIKVALLERYFPDKASNLYKSPVLYSEVIKKDILYDPAENYARKVIRKFEQMNVAEREEELILRSHIFRKAVLEIYDGRCAISGMKLEFGNNFTMVDACHIVPFADAQGDTITNGIALSPTLHRAFDRGLVSVSNDYRVLVHPHLTDHFPDVGIRQFNRQELYLPQDSRFYPSPEKFAQHRQRFAFESI
ncbi:MAG: HNH endonuclease [Prolixibacteraceae bacterium]|nr:HNH endonuclease [Prolixibacteraceae bacterium]